MRKSSRRFLRWTGATIAAFVRAKRALPGLERSTFQDLKCDEARHADYPSTRNATNSARMRARAPWGLTSKVLAVDNRALHCSTAPRKSDGAPDRGRDDGIGKHDDGIVPGGSEPPL